nr:MAG TPA: transposase-like protein [Caudoviricetes sp.]
MSPTIRSTIAMCPYFHVVLTMISHCIKSFIPHIFSQSAKNGALGVSFAFPSLQTFPSQRQVSM